MKWPLRAMIIPDDGPTICKAPSMIVPSKSVSCAPRPARWNAVNSRRIARERNLNRQLARWASEHFQQIEACDPVLPPDCFNRLADNWRPLMAIAEIVGGHWPTRAGAALAQLPPLPQGRGHQPAQLVSRLAVRPTIRSAARSTETQSNHGATRIGHRLRVAPMRKPATSRMAHQPQSDLLLDDCQNVGLRFAGLRGRPRRCLLAIGSDGSRGLGSPSRYRILL